MDGTAGPDDPDDTDRLDAEQFCYLETIGRVSGRAHTV